ncbi:MAG: DUF4864 domain-containing protein [Xanthobacteraceae bacterium]|nr:DUF4864 domain-containing protein [Xanthobacteraceae bacterium]
MRVIVSSLVVLALASMLGLAPPARAGDDAAAAQSVIRAQEEAFARDDAFAAFAFAAPAIMDMFRSADTFMSMVRRAYAPVYRHRSFEFGVTTHVSGGRISQQVHIIDADGVAWEALYTLEIEPDGTLRITACVLTKAIEA